MELGVWDACVPEEELFEHSTAALLRDGLRGHPPIRVEWARGRQVLDGRRRVGLTEGVYVGTSERGACGRLKPLERSQPAHAKCKRGAAPRLNAAVLA